MIDEIMIYNKHKILIAITAHIKTIKYFRFSESTGHYFHNKRISYELTHAENIL